MFKTMCIERHFTWGLISMCARALHTHDAACGSSEMVHELRFSTGIEDMYKNTYGYVILHVIKHNTGYVGL